MSSLRLVKPKLKHLFYSLHQRNHRRIVTIDGKVSYIGGFNIGKEYLGQDPKFGPWRDYHVRVIGNGATDMERQFAADWKEDTGEKCLYMKVYLQLGM